jgi:hypothetical protein
MNDLNGKLGKKEWGQPPILLRFHQCTADWRGFRARRRYCGRLAALPVPLF